MQVQESMFTSTFKLSYQLTRQFIVRSRLILVMSEQRNYFYAVHMHRYILPCVRTSTSTEQKHVTDSDKLIDIK